MHEVLSGYVVLEDMPRLVALVGRMGFAQEVDSSRKAPGAEAPGLQRCGPAQAYNVVRDPGCRPRALDSD